MLLLGEKSIFWISNYHEVLTSVSLISHLCCSPRTRRTNLGSLGLVKTSGRTVITESQMQRSENAFVWGYRNESTTPGRKHHHTFLADISKLKPQFTIASSSILDTRFHACQWWAPADWPSSWAASKPQCFTGILLFLSLSDYPTI